MNNVTVCGNLTKDAEIKFLDGGDQVASFSIADNGFAKGEKTVIFWDVTVWGKRAETIAQYFKKGGQVTVVGRMGVPVVKGERLYLKLDATDFSLPARESTPAPFTQRVPADDEGMPF